MQKIEQTSAAIAAASASTGWLSQANEIMAFIAYAVAIVSGALAIYSHFKRKEDEDTQRNTERSRNSRGHGS